MQDQRHGRPPPIQQTEPKADPARLKREREAFEKKGWIPWSSPMRPQVGNYAKAFVKAEADLRTAYNREIGRAVREKNKARENELRADLLSALEVRVVAVWEHQVNKGPVGRIRLYSNNCIGEPQGPATWSYRQGVLELRWPNPKAPGGAYVDTCLISDDGTGYGGKNQEGARIRGTRLC